MAPTTRATTHARGPPLLSLPAELRNNIYELCFTTKYNEDEKIDILTAEPPPCKALLLVCHQIYNEASLLYKTAYRTFWTEGKFEMKVPAFSKKMDRNATQDRIKCIESDCLDRMKSIDVVLKQDVGIGSFFTLIDKRGGWFLHAAPHRFSYLLLMKYEADQNGENLWLHHT